MAGNTRSKELSDIRDKLGLSVAKFADAVGVERTRMSNWIYGKSDAVTPEVLARAKALLTTHDVSEPKIPASQLLIPIPCIGGVAASSPIDWTDPFESEAFEFVPPEMGDGRGRFACTIIGDSMEDLLIQNDVCVFQSTTTPKLGTVVLFRSDERRATVKVLKHDGERFMLHALNSAYEPVEARGIALGYLVGIVRESGSKRVTVYDPTGIRP